MELVSVRALPGRRMWIILTSLSLAASARGAPETVPPRAPQTVTWDDVARLVEADPRLAAKELRVAAARGGEAAAGEVPNPTLEATLGKLRGRGGGESGSEATLALTMPLGWLSQRGPRRAAARAETQIAEADGAALRREVLLQLRTLFWELALEQARVQSLEELEAHTRRLAGTVRRRVEKGEARPVEATRVEIELEKVSADLEGARLTLDARRAELGSWLGLAGDEPLVVVADLEAIPQAMGRETALARVRASHPALAGSRARVRGLEAEVRAARRARIPSLAVTGSVGTEPDRRSYGVGVTVDVPLWSWSSGRILQAEAQLAAGRRDVEAAEREVEAGVFQAQAACERASRGADRFQKNVLPRSETAAATTERTYQVGEASVLELIDARRTLVDARRAYLDALSQAHIECSRLEAVVGEESP